MVVEFDITLDIRAYEDSKESYRGYETHDKAVVGIAMHADMTEHSPPMEPAMAPAASAELDYTITWSGEILAG